MSLIPYCLIKVNYSLLQKLHSVFCVVQVISSGDIVTAGVGFTGVATSPLSGKGGLSMSEEWVNV
jgi:hypothetical protein